MEKSLGNKRRRIGGPSDKEKGPDHIGEITRIHGNYKDGGTRTFEIGGKKKTLVVSKIFDNEGFGFHKITVERPLRQNFQASVERIGRLDEETGFKNLAASNKKNEAVRLKEIEAGKQRQETVRELLRALGNTGGDILYKDRKKFLNDLKALDRKRGVRLDASDLKAVLNVLGERDETAEICRDRDGIPELDPELRDTESVPLMESPHSLLRTRWDHEAVCGTPLVWCPAFRRSEPAEAGTPNGRFMGRIEAYIKREVSFHVPDAWIDDSKTKVGYEIPLNRHFYRYEPPRPLEDIEKDIKTLESEILALLKEVTA